MKIVESFQDDRKERYDWVSYDSIQELLDDSVRSLRSKYADWREHSDRWATGYAKAGAVHDLILAGAANPAAARKFGEIAGTLDLDTIPGDLMGESARRRRVWSDQGDPETDRVLDRRELWAGESKRGRPARVVRLGVNITRSMGNDMDGYAQAAAYCAAVADQLVKLGHAVEIVGCSVVRYGSWEWRGHSWPLKRPNEPLDIERILSMGHGALHRFFILKALRPSGLVLVPSPEAYARVGIDYAFGKQWTNDGKQRDIWQGIRNALAGVHDDSEALV